MLARMETGLRHLVHRLPTAGALACLLFAGCAGAEDTDSMDTRTPQQAAAEFLWSRWHTSDALGRSADMMSPWSFGSVCEHGSARDA